MRFSERTNWNTDESELACAYRERRAAGLPVADLTASNPTRCGFEYPADLLAPLMNDAALDYDPDPKGSLRAREAVCRYYAGQIYAEQGTPVKPEQIILTTSTSEAYGYLFKLLCNPGDTIMVPQPSYPLFDFLADAEVVQVAYVSFVYDHGWQLDLDGLRKQITNTTRAVVLVHPNNPTGHFTKLDEARELAGICEERGLALIVDEVFLDYALGEPCPEFSSFSGRKLHCLTFIVSGISKICGLPQMKAAWLLAVGPGSEEALARLEVLADTYLSMNAPVQQALPTWLRERSGIQDQIRARTRRNLAYLDSGIAGQRIEAKWVSRLEVEGGWYAVLRIPATMADDVTVRGLLDEGVWIHPGHFFGLAESGWLVVSLLGMEEQFNTGIDKLLAYIQQSQLGY